jgi:glycosyltransferase involved in cell wall biosynthesis
MKSNQPLVSIVLPVFKSERHLREAVESLLAQTYRNLEVVAVVDYLGDNSLKILKEIRKQDKRLRIYAHQQRYGLAVTLNHAIKRSKGQFIAFMDPMGISKRSRIAKQLHFLLKNDNIAIVGTQSTLLSKRGTIIRKNEFPTEHFDIHKELLSGLSIQFESCMVDKSKVAKDALKFKKKTHYPFLYADVFMRIALYKDIANLPQNLVFVRKIERFNKGAFDIKKKLTYIKLLIESTTAYDYKPSIKSLFSPIARGY